MWASGPSLSGTVDKSVGGPLAHHPVTSGLALARFTLGPIYANSRSRFHVDPEPIHSVNHDESRAVSKNLISIPFGEKMHDRF